MTGNSPAAQHDRRGVTGRDEASAAPAHPAGNIRVSSQPGMAGRRPHTAAHQMAALDGALVMGHFVAVLDETDDEGVSELYD
jgi:hypothetical protein